MYYHVATKNKILPFDTKWTNLEDTMLNERSQTMKDRYCTCPLYSNVHTLWWKMKYSVAWK